MHFLPFLPCASDSNYGIILKLQTYLSGIGSRVSSGCAVWFVDDVKEGARKEKAMAKIELRVIDPKLFEKGTDEQRVQMTYGDTDSPIVIDTDTAFLECEAQSKSASIKQWVVDFDNHKMKIADDVLEGNYQEITHPAAVSMVGQLVSECGIATLQALLGTLIKVYGKVSSNDAPPAPQAPEGDAPAEQPPESPNDSEVPAPVDLDV